MSRGTSRADGGQAEQSRLMLLRCPVKRISKCVLELAFRGFFVTFATDHFQWSGGEGAIPQGVRG